MTFEELAQVVANGFKQVMEEEEFETFEDMKNCYWWDTNDIKAEVRYYLNEVSNKLHMEIMLSDDGMDVYIGDNWITYRKFSAMWHKLLK